MSEAPELSLAAEFAPASREQWLELVQAVLRGAPFDRKLVARTYDGLRIEPLYDRRPDGRPIAARAPTLPWQILQRIDHPDPTAANAQALDDLQNGATGLLLVCTGAIGAHGYGLEPTEANLARALQGVDLTAGISLELDLGPRADDVPLQIAAFMRRFGVVPEQTNIRFGLDPLGALAASGCEDLAWSERAERFARLCGELARQGFSAPIAAADGRPVHAGGGADAQELAFVLAGAVAYLRALEAGGMKLAEARTRIFFRLAADADQFLSMAKFRALRRLWARVEAACGLDPKPAFVSGETAWRMMARRDPWVNLLRTTIAAFSAGLGGADAVTVLPFTAALGLPDQFARRLARNTQLILLEESNLAKVTDPAAGAGAIENLTDQLCQAAWSKFQEVEAAGGCFAALQAGLIQRDIAAVRAERQAAIERRKDPLTGVSEFPDLSETPVSVLDVRSSAPMPASPANITIEPMPSLRLAEPYERLRDASDRLRAATGTRPKVFLANLGRLADFGARALFAANFFAAGGIESVTNEGFTGIDEMAAAYQQSGGKLACLCGSDATYQTDAEAAARALVAAGCQHLYLAGRPGGQEEKLRRAGIGAFIFVGCDALAVLEATHHDIREESHSLD